jgi:hypothetical protein
MKFLAQLGAEMLGFLSLVAVVAMYLERHIASYYAMQTLCPHSGAQRYPSFS